MALVRDVLDTTLDEAGVLRLRDVPLHDRLTELEFHFPVSDLTPDDLRRILAADKAYTDSARGWRLRRCGD